MNRLTGTERSIVTEVAGTTRDVVEETVQLGQVLLRLSDTAGIRETDDPVEKIGVQRAREKFASAELIFLVFDASQELNDEDRQLLTMSEGLPSIAILNKTDLEEKIDKEYIKSKNKRIVYISARSGEGMQELSRRFWKRCMPPNWTLVRHFVHGTGSARMSAAATGGGRSRKRPAGWYDADAVTVSVEAAVDALLELTGEKATIAVVDEVFSHFCVGK